MSWFFQMSHRGRSEKTELLRQDSVWGSSGKSRRPVHEKRGCVLLAEEKDDAGLGKGKEGRKNVIFWSECS